MRILDLQLIRSRTPPVCYLELSPASRNARLNRQSIAPELEPHYRLENGSIHPARRTRVPRPPAAPRVRPHRVNIRRRHVRLDSILVQPRSRRSVADRIQQREEFPRALALAQHRVSDHRPQSRVRVLAAVLPDARHVSLYVAGVE